MIKGKEFMLEAHRVVAEIPVHVLVPGWPAAAKGCARHLVATRAVLRAWSPRAAPSFAEPAHCPLSLHIVDSRAARVHDMEGRLRSGVQMLTIVAPGDPEVGGREQLADAAQGSRVQRQQVVRVVLRIERELPACSDPTETTLPFAELLCRGARTVVR